MPTKQFIPSRTRTDSSQTLLGTKRLPSSTSWNGKTRDWTDQWPVTTITERDTNTTSLSSQRRSTNTLETDSDILSSLDLLWSVSLNSRKICITRLISTSPSSRCLLNSLAKASTSSKEKSSMKILAFFSGFELSSLVTFPFCLTSVFSFLWTWLSRLTWLLTKPTNSLLASRACGTRSQSTLLVSSLPFRLSECSTSSTLQWSW